MERPAPSRLTTSLLVAAIASVGAGLVHAAAAGTHNDDAQLAWMFALCAAAQIGWAALALFSPRRVVLAAGVVLNGACVAVWALTRTVGLFGPLADVESVGTQDLVAAVLGALAAAGALVALVGLVRHGGADAAGAAARRRVDVPVLAVAATLVIVLAVPAMAASHSHGDGDHHHDDGSTEVSAAAGHTHGEDATDTDGHAHTDDHAHGTGTDTADVAAADGPIVTVDDPRLTSAQRARASSLLQRTRDAMTAFPDEASIVAAGYTWIGDGRRPGGFQHFVHREYMGDGRTLDPAHIESLVLHVQPDGSKVLASAMYIAEPGTTMETVPDIAGELTSWHDHQNLCWNGNQIAGVLVNGVCRPGGTFRATAPMIHVWADDPACGPFTGIEGHGSTDCNQAHTHT